MVRPPVPVEFRGFQDIYVTAAVAFQPLGWLAGWLGLFQILSPNVASLGHPGKYRGLRKRKKKFHVVLATAWHHFVRNVSVDLTFFPPRVLLVNQRSGWVISPMVY